MYNFVALTVGQWVIWRDIIANVNAEHAWIIYYWSQVIWNSYKQDDFVVTDSFFM